ncbi:WD40-repeat-containing domain protein [Geopyxis carbonaria]|nr:WD40-repeat-containing domain protein [Geopyxis carbonaria]
MTMLCAISGEAPTNPVASSKSGTVFEKRLIEAYIAEHGKDPITGEELSTADLIELKSSNIVRPRPPNLTSIPALLATFQNEWDAIALETHSLRSQLAHTRQELSTALYQHDAATRVIARLMKERDEARDALSKVTVGAGSAPAENGEEMDVDIQQVPTHVQEIVDATKAELSARRKKRSIPENWATAETMSSFETVLTSEPIHAGSKSISLDVSTDLALLGGSDGAASIYSISQQQVVTQLNAQDGAINDVAWVGKCPVTGSGNGVVRIWNEDGSDSNSITSHAGDILALAAHPSGSILASVGADKSWVLHDVSVGKAITQIYDQSKLVSAGFHPDGHLFAAGTTSEVKLYDVRSAALAANFGTTSGVISSLDFSENGFWLAFCAAGQSAVEIWDLRKQSMTKSLDIGSRVDHVQWDYTGQFLSTAGSSGISVQQYSKPTKSWSEPLKTAVPAIATAWGPKGCSLVTVNSDGVLTILGTVE